MRLPPRRDHQREFWRLIRAGSTVADASECLSIRETTGRRWFRKAGGMPPLSLVDPLTHRFLTIVDRELILVGITAGDSVRARRAVRPRRASAGAIAATRTSGRLRNMGIRAFAATSRNCTSSLRAPAAGSAFTTVTIPGSAARAWGWRSPSAWRLRQEWPGSGRARGPTRRRTSGAAPRCSRGPAHGSPV